MPTWLVAAAHEWLTSAPTSGLQAYTGYSPAPAGVVVKVIAIVVTSAPVTTRRSIFAPLMVRTRFLPWPARRPVAGWIRRPTRARPRTPPVPPGERERWACIRG